MHTECYGERGGGEDHGRTGGGSATRGPGSTSTHLNFGPSQGQCGRTIRPLLPFPSVTSLSLVSSYSCVRLSPFLFPFRPARSPSPHPQKGPYRAIASYRARIHTLSLCRRMLSFFFLYVGLTYDLAKSQLAEGIA